MNRLQERIDILLRSGGPLKGKDIAKQLNAEKSVVNAFLHSHLDRYSQNSNYKWSLTLDRIVVTLPGQWISAEQWEKQLWEQTGGQRPKEITVVLESGCRLLLDCIALVLGVSNQCAAEGIEVVLDFSQEPTTLSYLDRAGFFEHLHRDVDVLPSRPTAALAEKHRGNSPALVEFGGVDPHSDNIELIEHLTDSFVHHTDERYKAGLLTIFGELIGNVREHSEATTIGFAGLQKHSKPRNHIQAVISDNGLGIPATLRSTLHEHHQEVFRRFGTPSLESDRGLVELVVGRGQLSRNGKEGGLGFKRSGDFARSLRANVRVRQEAFYVKFRDSKGKLSTYAHCGEVHPLRGTHIAFDFLLE